MNIPIQKARFTGLANRENCQNYGSGKKEENSLIANAKKSGK